jgi:hypothetical protein
MPDEPRLPTAIAGLENFTSSDLKEESEDDGKDFSNADSFFNLPEDDDDDEDDDKR